MPTPKTPADLQGIWSRLSLTLPGGSTDTTTRVLWLQAGDYYADIRLPASRPSFAGVRSLKECNPIQRTYLASQQGFAGKLVRVGDAWQWLREIDYQPATGKRDIGTLVYHDDAGDLMLETGVDEPYTEIWQRVERNTTTLALRRENAYLIAVGSKFILAKKNDGRVVISVGEAIGTMAEWRIIQSTSPWLEGKYPFEENPSDWEMTDSNNMNVRKNLILASAFLHTTPPGDCIYANSARVLEHALKAAGLWDEELADASSAVFTGDDVALARFPDVTQWYSTLIELTEQPEAERLLNGAGNLKLPAGAFFTACWLTPAGEMFAEKLLAKHSGMREKLE